MDAQTQSRARLTSHAIERQSQLLIETIDAALVEISPECVRWGAVSDPRRWLTPTIAPAGSRRHELARSILELAARYAAVAEDAERFIQSGAAGHDCEAKAALRDELGSVADRLAASLTLWSTDEEQTPHAPKAASEYFPQYVPRAVPRVACCSMFGNPAATMGGAW